MGNSDYEEGTMKRNLSLIGFAGMIVIAIGLVGPSVAGHLPAPTGLMCPVVGDIIEADWDDVLGATKYSVAVMAGYDRDGDSSVDATNEYDFGTSDRLDGDPIDQSDLDIPLSELDADFDQDGTTVTLSPIEVDLRVKSLHPGKGQGRQNGAFSDPCQAVP
jgi:hypothetical protein